MKLKRSGPEQYVTADGRWKITRDFELTECECPEQLCKHVNGVREEYHWYIFPNTEAGENMGLGDVAMHDSLKECREVLAAMYAKEVSA